MSNLMLKIIPLQAYKILFIKEPALPIHDDGVSEAFIRIRTAEARLDDFFLVADYFDHFGKHGLSSAVLEIAHANLKNDALVFRLATNLIRDRQYNAALKILSGIDVPDLLDNILIIAALSALGKNSKAQEIIKRYVSDPDFIFEIKSFDEQVLPQKFKSYLYKEIADLSR